MGLFSDLKMMKDTITDCIDMGKASLEASDRMDKLIEEAREHVYDAGFLSPANLKYIKDYDAAKKAQSSASSKLSNEERTKLDDAVDDARVSCMKSFQINKKFSQEFRDACQEAIKLYKEANNDDKLYDSIEQNILKHYKFKDDAEKAMVHQLFQSSRRNDEACEKMIQLIEEARKHSKDLTAADQKAITEFDAAQTAYKTNKSSKKNTALNEALESKETACMASFQKNPKFSEKFRTSCRDAAKLYKEANDAIEALAKYQ